tara:strand:+ start:7290 stop:7628 length:339 start_codon:yes stop_codon:yes gene_type:complete
LRHRRAWVSEPYQLRRRGNEARVIYGGQNKKPDTVLIRAIAKAHPYFDAVKAGERIIDIAKREGTDKTNIRRRLELAFLSPKLVEMTLEGGHSDELKRAGALYRPPILILTR